MPPTEESSQTTNPSFVRPLKVLDIKEIAEAANQGKSDLMEFRQSESDLSSWPHVVDVLNMSPVYGNSGYETELHDIDTYVRETMQLEQMPFTQLAYESVINQLEREWGLSSRRAYPDRIKALATIIQHKQNEPQ